MNIAAKIWSWIVVVWGAYAMLAGLLAEEVNGYMILGGLVMLVSGLVALVYIWKDDAIRKQQKAAAEEERIARIVTDRMNGGK